MVAIVNQWMEKNFGFLFQELKSLLIDHNHDTTEKKYMQVVQHFLFGASLGLLLDGLRSTYLSCAVKKSWQHLAGKLEKNARIKPRAAK